MRLIVFALSFFSAAATSFKECQAGEQCPIAIERLRAAEVSAFEVEQQAVEFVQIKAQVFQSSYAAKEQEIGKQQHAGLVSDRSYDFDKVLHAKDDRALLQDPDYNLLGEKDAERVRFIAYHPEWRDVMDVWMDGFFQRYHSGDAGTWALQGDTLYLKWIGWEEEALLTKDGGRNFVSTKNNFLLKNPAPDHWWLSHFDVNFRTDNERHSAMDVKEEVKGMHLALAEASKTRRDANNDTATYENQTRAALDRHGNISAANLTSSVDVSKHFSGRRLALKEHVDHSGEELVNNDAKIPKHQSGSRKEVHEQSTNSVAKTRSNVDVAKQHESETGAATIGYHVHPVSKALNHALVAKGHGLGVRATLGEHGYASVAMLKNDAEMEVFMRRAINFLGHQISDEDIFKATVPDFSGVRNVQSYEALLDHLDKQALDPTLKKRYLLPASSAN